MEQEQIQWTVEKQHQLQGQLIGFWSQNEWNMSLCPLVPVEKRSTDHRRIRFACLSPSLNAELKYACWRKLESGDWSPTYGTLPQSVHRLVEWLNVVAPSCPSLLQNSLNWWELSLRSFLVERGTWKQRRGRKLLASQQFQEYEADDPCVGVLRALYRVLQDVYDSRNEYDKDIWDLRKLGVPLNLSRPGYTLNFTRLRQPWLRQAAKSFLKYELAVHSAADCFHKLTALNTFSAFLTRHYSDLHPSELARSVILDYLGYLGSHGITAKSRCDRLLHLRCFLELCASEKWVGVPEKPLIHDEDLPRRGKGLPRFIPQEVLDQLNRHIDALSPQIMRMVLVLQEVGLRCGELCTLQMDCLLQDAAGDWFLRSYQGKKRKEHCVPISREVAAVIAEQQQEVRKAWGQQAMYLFPRSKGQPFRQGTFIAGLNRMAYDKQIHNATGKLWHFQSHQFRHTVATRMLNLGVPQHVIQRYLGHETPAMTARYAYLFAETEKEEFKKFRGKVVDVVGKVIAQEGGVNSPEVQWLKKNIHTQALPNGYCGLPLAAKDCPYGNACLTCPHFRTDASFLPQLKTQRANAERLRDEAREKKWLRVIEVNEKVIANLDRIIPVLEEPTDDGHFQEHNQEDDGHDISA